MLWLITILLCVCYSLWKQRYFSSRGVHTLPNAVPFFGNLTAVTFGRENFVDTIAKGYEKFKSERYFGLYQYHVPTVVVTDLELIRQIMVRDFQSFTDRGIHIEDDCDPVFGRNLIMLKGSKWRTMRTAILPAFSVSRCRNMTPLMNECASAAIKFLRDNVSQQKQLDVNTITAPYVNDVIASCAFGFALNTFNEPDNHLHKLAQKAAVQDTTQIMKFFGHANMKSLMKLLKIKMISTRDAENFSYLFKSALKARRENNAPPRPDFIQTLVDVAHGKQKHESSDDNNNELSTADKFTDDDLVAQAVLFYVAGYDTTANLINYFLCEMADNPQIQERLRAELNSLPGDDEIQDENIYEAIQGLQYLEMCVCEVLRLWPLVGSWDRRSVKNYDFGPVREGSKSRLVAKAGIHVWFPTYCIQRDERYWPNPNACVPERFAPGNKADIRPFTYMPFGNGPRHCIGARFATLTAKVFLVKFLRKYRVRATKNASSRLAARAFVLRKADGFNVTIEPIIK